MLLWLLFTYALAVPVQLPPTAATSDWAQAARLVGVTLKRASVGARASVHVEGGVWVVQIVDAEGRKHRLKVAAPTTDSQREDLLNTIKSLAEPVADTGLKTPAFVVPRRPKPVERATRRRPGRSDRSPSPPVEPVVQPSVAVVEPVLPPPTPLVDPAELDLGEFDVPDVAGRVRVSPPPTPPPWTQVPMRTVPFVGLGGSLRYGASPRPQLSLGVGVERKRVGVGLALGWMPWGRVADLGPNRSWTQVSPALRVYRAGPGFTVGGTLGVAARIWSDNFGVLATTSTPQLGALVGWRVQLSSPLMLHANVWSTVDAGRTSFTVGGDGKGVLHPISAGLAFELSRKRGSE